MLKYVKPALMVLVILGLLLAFGLLIGVVGPVVHRVRPWDVPLGLVLAVACVAAAGLRLALAARCRARRTR